MYCSLSCNGSVTLQIQLILILDLEHYFVGSKIYFRFNAHGLYMAKLWKFTLINLNVYYN